MPNTGAVVLVITVESVVLAAAEPPPETATAFTCGDVALAATFTVTAIAGQLAPAASASVRVQVVAAHVHPVPAMETRVNPVGTVSVTVTSPVEGAAPAAFDTFTV